MREPGLELTQVQSAIHRALEDPPAAFSDSYLRGRFSSLRQLESPRALSHGFFSDGADPQ